MPLPPGKPKHFRTAAAFRAWLEKNHDKKRELWVGFYKKSSGKAGMVYKESVDEALCFGWIDGLVRSYDEESYMQRFTPRKASSHWSTVNIRKIAELEAAGRMHPAGRAAFEKRDPKRIARASYEQAEKSFDPEQEKALKANTKAWAFWEAQPWGYRRTAKHWVISARKEETRQRRLGILIDHCARQKRIPPLDY
jgi:uncharacterized protein YdeI (YjbR/CyaY-like superfamily)